MVTTLTIKHRKEIIQFTYWTLGWMLIIMNSRAELRMVNNLLKDVIPMELTLPD